MAVSLLLNVHAGKARRDPALVGRLKASLNRRGSLFEARNVGELPSMLQVVKRQRPSVLFLFGGDGTLRETLSHLDRIYGPEPWPKIAILRGGTMNTVATTLHLRRHPVEQLQSVLNRIERSLPLPTTSLNILRVNQGCGFMFGVGAFLRFIEIYGAHPNPTPLRGARLLTATMFSVLCNGSLAGRIFEHFPVSVWRDGEALLQEEQVSNVGCACIRHLGFGFHPFVGAEAPDGSFGILIFRGSPRRIALHLPRFYWGRPVRDPWTLQLPAKELRIRLRSPMRAMLDGDLLSEETEFRISSGPRVDFVTA